MVNQITMPTTKQIVGLIGGCGTKTGPKARIH
jgi:hypothetical protein